MLNYILSKFRGKTSPRAALDLIATNVQEKIPTIPVKHFIMEIDFQTEEITFELPVINKREKMKNAFLFAAVTAAMKAELSDGDDLELWALIVNWNAAPEPITAQYFFIKDGEKLSDTKTIN